MTLRAALFVAVAAVAGCKSKSSAPAAQGSGSSAQAAEAPTVRPSQQPLPQLPPLDAPTDPKHAEKADLGHALFFDKRLSAKNDHACSSCHLDAAADKKQGRVAPV